MRTLHLLLSLFMLPTMACNDSHALNDPNPGIPDQVVPENPSLPTQPPVDSGIESGNFEWDNYPVSVVRPAGKVWKLNDLSDEFKEDIAPLSEKGNIGKSYYNFYHAGWHGPAPTYWQHDHVWVADSKLKIKATRPQEAKDLMLTVSSGKDSKEMPATYTGCLTSVKQVVFPVYIEARVKLSKSPMASDVWLLSPDDTQEIDIVEAYGGDRTTGDGGRTFYGPERIHLSHHVFIREPFQDYQPTMEQTWYKDDLGTLWRDDYHTYGVFWRDAWNLEYYIDGKLVRVVGKEHIDPLGYTGGTGLTKPMDIIINMEDQSWRAIGGLSPTDEELANEEDATMNVDWIRVYDLVDAPAQ